MSISADWSTSFVAIDAESNGLAGQAFAVALTLNRITPLVLTTLLLDRGPSAQIWDEMEIEWTVLRCPITTDVDAWVAENVLPAISDVPENTTGYAELLEQVDKTIDGWNQPDLPPLVTHVAWPVEARLLLDVYAGESAIRRGPYPLVDVASMLLVRGYDPISVDGYLRTYGIAPPSGGSPHDPLYDARATARCYAHLMATAGMYGHV